MQIMEARKGASGVRLVDCFLLDKDGWVGSLFRSVGFGLGLRTNAWERERACVDGRAI